MGIHDEHRKRMKQKFIDNGMDSFADHEVLELLLYYAISRRDVNPIAHELINRFGSLAAVFDAPIEELMKVEGVGEHTAMLIKMLPQFSRRYLISRTSADNVLDSPKKAGEYVQSFFYSMRKECVFMVCLDAKNKVITTKCVTKGDISSVPLSPRQVVEFALANQATSVILAHNHPNGFALPSSDDYSSTRRIEEALRAVEVKLLDHIVVADDDFVSMSDNGFFDRY
ncbi:MAG: DNA repair protein RadC [Oscillospiraceae bacterium]|nr:DNA repair protein RadC [Oscillospiraceae bacterium]